ncbi:MAG: hypothetical protein KatS3mg082_0498 [Nitrospiraceae bacterium]|nr:MAG: hypothetical protein KatS3mg082_0498 [Nitrospiraceae bacterium]
MVFDEQSVFTDGGEKTFVPVPVGRAKADLDMKVPPPDLEAVVGDVGAFRRQ